MESDYKETSPADTEGEARVMWISTYFVIPARLNDVEIVQLLQLTPQQVFELFFGRCRRSVKDGHKCGKRLPAAGKLRDERPEICEQAKGGSRVCHLWIHAKS